MDGVVAIIDVVARETLLFAAVGLLIGGVDDLLVDCVYLLRRLHHRGRALPRVSTLPAGDAAPVAIFVPAWDESRVIGAMLTTALARYGDQGFILFVGTYPNDRATVDAVAAVAERDERIVLVIGDRPGPTTKADCLNTLWRALARHDRRTGRATATVLLHDAEDVVHPDELRVIAAVMRGHDVVQLPVLPLIRRGSLVSGHYADEFAESHNKIMPVRLALGAGMPLAGTGCAIAASMLARVAAERGGEPFDATSLTEDYELGLRIAELGGRGLFARVVGDDGHLVAVRAFFPDTLDAAVRQKTRWMTGIALAGWDRTGWSRPWAWSDHWMRMRDRRAPIAVLVLATAYVAMIAWGLSGLAHWSDGGGAVSLPPAMVWTNTGLLVWRLAMRAAFTGRTYGAREAAWSVPRFFVGNLVALIAAPRAMARYLGTLRGGTLTWDKTRHDFPDLAEMEAS